MILVYYNKHKMKKIIICKVLEFYLHMLYKIIHNEYIYAYRKRERERKKA